jgi:peptidoglycan hydrolase-like protein with peptidoglycan-binding domain
MANIPEKHIGIFCDGEVWHYSNSAKKVVRQTPEEYAQHFSGAGFAVYFGTFPAEAGALLAPLTPTPDVVGPALHRGMSDNIDVANWQQFLIILKLLPNTNGHSILDGDFGPMTEDATEAFQVSAQLPASGAVDGPTNAAAVARGFISRSHAKARTALTHVTPAMTVAAVDALNRLSPNRVFYTEEVLDTDGTHVIARLEPHKHTQGTQLRFWHRGITLYSF